MTKRLFIAIDLPQSTRQLLAGIDPHITLARCRGVSAQSLRKFLQSNAEFDAGMIRVEDFHLYSSKLTPAGPIHTRELTVSCSRGR